MRIFVTTEFEGLHRWADAPEETAFLRQFHRHLFRVRLEIEVRHDDRELEFFKTKKGLNHAIKVVIDHNDAGSCEQIAIRLLEYFTARLQGRQMICEVSEDGENGAVVFANRKGDIF